MGQFSGAAAKGQDITAILREIDRRLTETWPSEVTAQNAAKLLETQEQIITDALDGAGNGEIQTIAHAVFHDHSRSAAHREAARRWFEDNTGDAKKVRFVFDRFDALARLKRLKEILAQSGAA